MNTQNTARIDKQAQLVNDLDAQVESLQKAYDKAKEQGLNTEELTQEIWKVQGALFEAKRVYNALVDLEFR